MNNEKKFKKFLLFSSNGIELGTVSIEHLWADVFALKIKILSLDGIANLERVIQEALLFAESNKARLVIYRLIKAEVAATAIGQLLPSLGFKKKTERIEIKKNLSWTSRPMKALL